MIYKMLEMSTGKASGHTYVLAHYWRKQGDHKAGKPPARINDFLMQLRPTGQRIVTDENGWLKTKEGAFIDPAMLDPTKPEPEWERETVDRDVPAQIMANIEAYWERAEAGDYPADHCNQRIERDRSDPHGVLARPDVAALEGATKERAG